MTKKAMFIIISSLLFAFIVTATVIIVLGNKEKENLTATTNTTEETTITTETVEYSEVTTSTRPSPDEIQASIDELERTSESLAEASASISESIEASISESIAESEREAQAEPPATTARSYNPHLSESSISISVGDTNSFNSQASGVEVLDAPCGASLDYREVDVYNAGSYTAYFNAFDGSFSLPLAVNVT